MTGRMKICNLLLICGLFLAVPSSAFSQEVQSADTSHSNSQQQDMVAILEDSVPRDSDQQNQALENPRIIVHENLDELPEVRTVSPDEELAEDEARDKESEGFLDQARESFQQMEEELDIESSQTGTNVVLEKTDRFMELSRVPLTYLQENVPFLTKRDIIFFGRLELDYAHFSSGVLEDESGLDLRRFRLGLAGRVKFWPGWNYKLEVDLTDGENTLSDAYISWRSNRWGTLRIGNQKVAQTLSGQTSSLSIPFMERPLPVLAFTLTRRLGVGWNAHLKIVGANITVFGLDPNKGVGSEGWAARAYFNPAKEKFHVIHIGGSFMQLSSDDDARLRARPESHVTDIRLVDTGVWPDVSTSSAAGLEVAAARGPVTLRSEFYRAEWSRTVGSNPKFRGLYVEASWFLSGEMAHYRDGKFIRPNINRARGAWELAARFSSIDLNDEDVQGGTQKNLSFGVNWYSKTHWRFMGNLIKVKAEDGPFGEQKPWIIQFRAQYYF